MRFFMHLYDYLKQHRTLRLILLFGSIILMLLPLPLLSLTEDITDFLPLTQQQRSDTHIYQQLAESDKIVLIFSLRDSTQVNPDLLADAIDSLQQQLYTNAPEYIPCLTTQIDYEAYLRAVNHIYSYAPYYLTEADYSRIDSLLLDSSYVARQVILCRQRLELPLSGMLTQQITADPLNLFSPLLSHLTQYAQGLGNFALYDGYMITADKQRAFAFFSSPFGMNDTKNNASLLAQLQQYADHTQSVLPDVQIHLHGAPVVAVGNARQIRYDSAMAILVAIVLILLLLWRALPRKRDIFLILLTVSFGWLMGISVMALFRHEVSLIVLGISSVLIGIAVNYPLHLLVHRKYTASPRETLQETLSPLIIGNITTVGAFLTLLPLSAVALHDLGLFSAAMLVGTILFTVIFLPHLLPKETPSNPTPSLLPRSLSKLRLPKHTHTVAAVVLLAFTVLLTVFSFRTNFDTDVSHLNYMTPQQRDDFRYFNLLAGQPLGTEIYLVSQAADWSTASEKALSAQAVVDSLLHEGLVLQQRSATRYLPSPEEQTRRIARWQTFCSRHADTLQAQLYNAAQQYGFQEQAFQPFIQLLNAQWQVQDYDFFDPVLKTMFQGYYLPQPDSFTLADRLIVPDNAVQQVEQRLAHFHCFDMTSLNASVATRLSDNFNYIGLACSLIVFLFLWIAFRSFWVALIAFLPMAVSWLWILGIMSLCGISFNIVNIILATFIFGQGDDYTIFITEGQLYERRTGKPILPQYRQSILLSAAIMFVGIGVLVFAKHPAMHSLGQVTLIGMSVVVLMAFLLPPLCFRFYDKIKNILRRHHHTTR